MDSATFHARLGVCKQCQHWSGVCTKGHATQSPTGCPVKTFPPLPGHDFDSDPAQVVTSGIATKRSCCGTVPKQVLTWRDVLLKLTKSIKEWLCAGLPLAKNELHQARYVICKRCPHFNQFYCRECGCVAFVKTKLFTEKCPVGKW